MRGYIPPWVYENVPYLFLWEGKDLSKEPWCPPRSGFETERLYSRMISDLGPHEFIYVKGGETPCQQTHVDIRPNTCVSTELPEETQGNGETPTCTSPS